MVIGSSNDVTCNKFGS